MVKLAIAVAALLTSCGPRASSPAIGNVEPEQPPPRPELVCTSPWVRPAMFCFGDSLLVYSGCFWRCVRFPQ